MQVGENTEELKQAKRQVEAQWRRRLSVAVNIEAEAADDSPLGALVALALEQYLQRPAAEGSGAESMKGSFESAEGLDVNWRAMNQFFIGDKLVGENGVDAQGNVVDWYDFNGKPAQLAPRVAP